MSDKDTRQTDGELFDESSDDSEGEDYFERERQLRRE